MTSQSIPPASTIHPYVALCTHKMTHQQQLSLGFDVRAFEAPIGVVNAYQINNPFWEILLASSRNAKRRVYGTTTGSDTLPVFPQWMGSVKRTREAWLVPPAIADVA
jgi:hypothetical protein